MAICKYAILKAIEQHQPLGSEQEDAKNKPFKIGFDSTGESIVCFGEQWCTLLDLENKCPRQLPGYKDIEKE